LPVSWPEDRSGFHRLEIRPEVRSILGLDTGEAAAWRDVVGGDWVIHRLRWEPRPLARAILAQYHSPDVCLPAAGCIQKADLGLVSIAGPGGTVSLRGYEFEESGHPLFVFYALREDWMSEDQEPGRSLPWARLRLVWQGRRSSGQTAIHVALRGASDAAEAIARARRELPRVFFPAALPAAGAQAS
jgi:hypothetical protein